MNEQLRLLIELQELDSRIIEKTRHIEEIPATASAIEKSMTTSREDHERAKHALEAARKKQRDREAALEDINQKIEKLKSRASDIKTNEGYQAHLKEIESSEAKRFEVENEILELMEKVESASKALKAEEAKLKEDNKGLEVQKNDVLKEGERLAEERKALNETRNAMVAKIDPEVYDTYMFTLDVGYGLAVVEAKDEICGGCNMNIMPQLFVELRKNEEIFHCPQCRRILYYKEAPSEEAS